MPMISRPTFSCRSVGIAAAVAGLLASTGCTYYPNGYGYGAAYSGTVGGTYGYGGYPFGGYWSGWGYGPAWGYG